MQPTITLRFARGLATLAITIGSGHIAAILWGPREHGTHPRILSTMAPMHQCHRTRSTDRNDTYPETLWMAGRTAIGLTAAEANSLDDAIRDHALGSAALEAVA